jgi:hypothetical protein
MRKLREGRQQDVRAAEAPDLNRRTAEVTAILSSVTAVADDAETAFCYKPTEQLTLNQQARTAELGFEVIPTTPFRHYASAVDLVGFCVGMAILHVR